LDDITLEQMARNLVFRYRRRGFLNPELLLKNNINEKMSSGKTKEVAIEELYEEEKPK
jgi:hypothetical protein